MDGERHEVNLGTIKINTMDLGSHLGFGQNMLVGRWSVRKKNSGFGEQNSDCCLFDRPIAIVNDNDGSDFAKVKITRL